MPIPTPRQLLIALNAAPLGVPRLAWRLAGSAGGWEAGARAGELAARFGLDRAEVEEALAVRPHAAAIAAAEEAAAARLGARLLTPFDAGWPPPLADLTDPPAALYLAGELPSAPAVAIVGARRATPYGREAAELFARWLAARGATVVSGFARGIDAAAHRGALAAPGGTTVAVLGAGLGVDYPRGQRRLAAEIAGRGALLTELPCGRPPRAWNFPVRNRVIAALSRAVLVVEAAARSGSLITARQALDLGRDVWAVPGAIFDERALGPNALIRDGALPALHPRDLAMSLGLDAGGAMADGGAARPAPAAASPPDGLPARLLSLLPVGRSCTQEQAAALCGAPAGAVAAALLELEIGGWLRRSAGPAWCRKACEP